MSNLPILPFDFARLVFEVEAQDPLRLPDFSGSLLRGTFGHSLRRLACMTGSETCSNCGLRQSCLFPALFEPQPREESATDRHKSGLPPPFVFEPPDIGTIQIEPGENWRFAIRLFGSAIAHAPLVVEAIRRACAKGLTPRRSTGRLVRVLSYQDDQLVDLYDPEAGTLEACRFWKYHNPIKHSTSRSVSIRLVTPLRMQSNGKVLPLAELTAKRLANDIIRRTRLLAFVCANDMQRSAVDAWPVSSWLAELQSTLISADLHWFEWQRTSSRQKKLIRLGGWLGEVRIADCPPNYLALLQIGQLIGIGKETAFGFGQFEIQFN